MRLVERIKTRTDAIVEHLLAKQYATQPDIDAAITAAKGDDDEESLLLAYGALRVMLSDRTPDKEDREARRGSADRIILDALRGAPKAVTLTEPLLGAEGRQGKWLREINVHPKSLNALIELAERDAVIGFFNAGIEVLEHLVKTGGVTPQHAEYLARAVREVAYQQQVCVWIVTHAGPDLPFPEDATAPDLPGWAGKLSPVDVLLIFRAHEEVNAGRLAALQSLPRGKKKGDSAERGWGVYLANMASLMNRTAEQLSRDQSLAALFAQSYVHAVEQERQMEEAGKK